MFRGFPDDVAVAGIISSVTSGAPLDIKVAADLLSRVARSNLEPLRVADDDLKARLRAYLKSSIDLVLRQDDFHGREKANLASSIAQVGKPEDMADLVTLIRADIERMRRARAALAAGDRGPLGNGASFTYAGWHIAAVMQLDSAGAEQVLIDQLPEPEYSSDAAAAMARDFVAKPEHSFYRGFRYGLVWAARECRTPPPGDDQRHTRFVAALNAEIRRLRERTQDGKPAAGLKELAKALAAIDGRRFGGSGARRNCHAQPMGRIHLSRRRRALVDGGCRIACDHRVRSARFHLGEGRELDAGFRQISSAARPRSLPLR